MMKNILRKVSIFVALLFALGLTEVYAATGSVRVSSSTSNAVVGNTFTVTVTVSSNEALGAWQYSLNYNSNLFSLVSSDVPPFWATQAQNATTKTVNYKYIFKAIAKGTGVFTISGSSMALWKDDGEPNSDFIPTITTATVKVMTQQELQASYSKNNNLKALEIEGYTFEPEFNKDTLEYNLDVPNDVEKVNIKATKEDGKARVVGDGEISLVEGPNKVNIIVTAENGSTKTYVLNINVKELDPINVTINGSNYTVVRKKDVLTAPTSFEEKTIIIEDKEVPAFYSSKADLTIVGLNDENGNVSLYIYKEKNNSYQEFKIIELGNLIVYPLGNHDDLNGYEKLVVEINEYKIDAYQKTNGSDYYLVKGINLETGKENFYQYDKLEKTLQRYDFESNKGNEDFYLIMLACAGGVILLCLIIILSLVSKNGKKVNKKELLEETIKVDKPKKNKKEQENVSEEKEEVKEVKKEKKKKKNKKEEKEKTILDDDF